MDAGKPSFSPQGGVRLGEVSMDYKAGDRPSSLSYGEKRIAYLVLRKKRPALSDVQKMLGNL